MFPDAITRMIQRLLDNLDTLGISARHAREISSIARQLTAYSELGHLHDRASHLKAPTEPDSTALAKRLAEGRPVTDAELIDYGVLAAAASSAVATAIAHGTDIGKAVQGLVSQAKRLRAHSVRDEVRRLFDALIVELRAVLAAGDPLPNTTVAAVSDALLCIDGLSGDGRSRSSRHDYWCIHDDRAGKWLILSRSEAEAMLAANDAYAAAQKAASATTAQEHSVMRTVPQRISPLRR